MDDSKERNPTGRLYAAALQPRNVDGELEAPPTERIVEALLFAGGQPLTPQRVGEVVGDLPPERVRELINRLNRNYRTQNRPYTIQQTDQGYVLSLRPRYQGLADRMRGTSEARLSKSAIEVLSLIAFRQPVTRPELEILRSGDPGPMIRQLVRLGLVAVQPAQEGETATRYGTTGRFLELFGLSSLEDLPQTLDLQQI